MWRAYKSLVHMLSKKWSKTYYLSSYSVDVLSSGNDFTSANKDVDVIEIFLNTVWPEPIWKKVNTSQLLLSKHQSTYPRGPESASIEIP